MADRRDFAIAEVEEARRRDRPESEGCSRRARCREYPMPMDSGQRRWHQRERRHLAMRQERRGGFEP